MGIEVKATQDGYYGTRRRKGAEFSIADEKDFSANWMQKLSPAKPVDKVEQDDPVKPKKKVSKKK